MTVRRYRMPEAAFTSASRTTTDGLVNRLGPSDMPAAFDVETSPDDRKIVIRLVYAVADREELLWSTQHGGARVAIGKFSHRLFAFELTFAGGFDARPAAEDMLGALRDLRETAELGPRMNYDATRIGLDIENNVTPAWLIDAMQSMRPSGAPSGRFR